MSGRPRVTVVLTVSAIACVLAGCGGGGSPEAGTNTVPDRGLPQGDEPVALDPADFTTTIDNPYWPMRPGSRWIYRETDAGGARQRVVVTVTHGRGDRQRRHARVVRDVATEDGGPVEVTDDWYAQDRGGNVWYLGEATAEYETASRRRPRGLVRGGRRRRAGRHRDAGATRSRACATGRSTTPARPRTTAP